MSKQASITVRISNVQGASTTGSVEHLAWDKKERTARGAKAWAGCWAAAIAAIFLPLVHFVLVPSLILAGPIVFYFMTAQAEMIAGGKGVCPTCGKEFAVARTGVKWPLSDICNHCHNRVELVPA